MTDGTDEPVQPVPSQNDEVNGSGKSVVVGIGASAGGLRALKDFFATVPADSGIAFVVVVHLSPNHESHLADLLQTRCAIPVMQVTGETLVEPNHVYVIPPGKNLSAVDSHLRIAPLADARMARTPIDHFFKTLAATHDGSSIGLILSGSGSDGNAGIRYIRDHGGMAIAQDPHEAEYDGMPRSAIATGSVDLVLPIAAMMPQIIEFARAHPRLATGAEEASQRPEGEVATDPLQTLLTLVRLRTGHDFLRYKRSTVTRRVSRRMQILNLESVHDYVELLRSDAQEAEALLDDLLINVTSFFRDPEVFRTLESEVIPSLFEGKGRGDSVRVWSVGCATGEEAYSLGMLLLEEAGRRTAPPQIQVFATDLHEASLQFGRDALFSEMIEAEISPERLERFFRHESSGYRVMKDLRDIVVFASHNLLRDPPFSRQDLIVCRNLLIYLQRDVQEEIIEVFHYALCTGGRLLLGTAEVLDRSELFTVENKAAHLYRRREGHRGAIRMPVATPVVSPRFPALDLQVARVGPEASYGVVHQRMLERYAPPSILVGSDHVVIHLSNNAGRYLQHPGGEPTINLFKLVREEFQLELRTAMHVVREKRAPWRSQPIEARIDGEERFVTLRVSPADEPELEGLVLVIFDESDEKVPAPDPSVEDVDTRILEVEAELDTTRSRMQALIEEFETTQEEMRAANEELQSANDELRSTMEELETSREELQSVNEELQTLNQENRHKVEELSQLSSDLQNLLQATDVATIFLDRNLRILRYTPRVSEIFNVRYTDRGRPLADLTHRLGYEGLIDDARRVLATLVPSEHEVEGPSSHSWYVLRIAPYRTMDDRIEGVVITLVDVTDLKNIELALRRTEGRQGFLVRLQDATRVLSDPIQIQRTVSRHLGEHLGANRVTYAEIEGEDAVVRGAYVNGVAPLPPRVPTSQLGASLHESYNRDEPIVIADVRTDDRLSDAERQSYLDAEIESLASIMIIKDGRWIAAFSAQSKTTRIWSRDDLAILRDVGERMWDAVARARIDQILRESEERYRLTVEAALNYAIFTVNADGRIESWSPGAAAVFGWSADEAIGQHVAMMFTPEDRAAGLPEAELDRTKREGSTPDRRWHERKDGRRVFIDGSTHVLKNVLVGQRFVKIGQDVTQRLEWERALNELNESLEERVAKRTHQLSRANAARDVLRLQLVQAEERERQRLARELHDEIGQHLTALGLGLQALSDVAPPNSEVDRRAAQLRGLVASLSQEMHALAMRLRPKALDDFGLHAALAAYVDAWSQRSGIAVDLQAAPDVERLAPHVESVVYRVVQEALTNIAKHSRATRASVQVERRDGQIVAIVEDNGRGFDARSGGEQKTSQGLGLLGIHERAELLGGTAQIESTVGSGTTVFVRIPASPVFASSSNGHEDRSSEEADV
jgi:two-component system CheB/CheR fusion protein